MRCPSCAATNPPQARWCGQCYTTLGDAVAPTAEPPGPPAPASSPDTDAGPVAAQPADRSALHPSTRETGIHRTDEGLAWTCHRCGIDNPLELATCTACGAAFADRFRDAEPEAPVDWRMATVLTAVAPGAGHLAARAYGTGVARLLLFVLWFGGGLVVATSAGSLGAAGPLLAGAAVLWVVSLLDIVRLQGGEQPLLGGRVLLGLVVAVLLLSMVGLFAAAGSGPTGAL